MFRLVRPRLLQTSRSASEDLVSESLATFRQVFCEGNPGQLWSCTSGRGFAKIPGSEPLPSSSRPKRFGTRKGLPAEEQTPSQAASGSDISAEAHASNIATLQRETAATGIRALVMQVQNQSPCLHCMASYLCWLVWYKAGATPLACIWPKRCHKHQAATKSDLAMSGKHCA